MLIKAKVVPESDKSQVVKKKKDQFVVYVREKAQENKANKEMCKLISSYFKIPEGKVRIVKGGKKKRKIIDINLDSKGQITSQLKKQ